MIRQEKNVLEEWSGGMDEKSAEMEYYVECLKGQGEVLCMNRQTRERRPLPTVETEVNGGERVQMKGVLLWLVRWGLP